MYIDPITRQFFNYATPKSCDNNPQNIKELDRDDDDENYVLATKPVFSATPMLFEPKKFQCTLNQNTSTEQEAGIFSDAELTNLRNSDLLTKHSDTEVKFWQTPSRMTF